MTKKSGTIQCATLFYPNHRVRNPNIKVETNNNRNLIFNFSLKYLLIISIPYTPTHF